MSDDLVEMARLAKHDERMATGALYGDLADRIEKLEDKLEKAVEALGTALSEMVDYADTHPAWSEIWEAREAARTTLKELTGGKDE